MAETKIEQLTLEDGRIAQRHTFKDENGNEIIEIFAEEKKPLKLEKRIVRETKNVVAKEIHETIKDGVVSYQEVHSLEPETPLQIRERIGLADHAKIVDGDYVRKEEIETLITEGVVAGVQSLMESIEPIAAQSLRSPKVLSAQEVVEKNVAEKSKVGLYVTIAAVGILAAQVGFTVYWLLM